ncbi:MAG: molybdenum cofactor guanylyltransferase [Clostridium sp.]|uniref:molybdenum cofactor guanylyltransferase n=1 Tax=Clostridium sp. TaxID=1506 RepID=UPI0029149177|nr:molybdenum cofactor guanylyltransferase [Clostridium sp.]MDU7148486.1 molybdenum cofactor guanylyltransferase [Clostridium sp.]MDU7240802.1 molybdenum cofactor guanylyltransferase [Clostridium sp.]
MINKTLAILAGGKSSRMNYNNKALLLFKEKTFIENIIDAGKDFDEIIIISNKKEDYRKFNLKIFGDIYLGNGPLSGIHSALKNAKNDKVLCIACDMPLITKDTLNIIGNLDEEYEVLVPKINEKLQPLCSIYSKELIPKIEESLIKNENKLQKFIMSTKYKVLEDKTYEELNNRYFSNINTINEYNDLEEI